jgi:urease accessory protein
LIWNSKLSKPNTAKTAVWDKAFELDDYRDEPGQMPSGAVGKNGSLHLGFERRGKRTILRKLRRRFPYFAHRALYWDEMMPDLPCVFLITTTGCVLQGDRLHLGVELGPGAEAHLTTQSGTQIHTMDANFAAQSQEFLLEEDSYLEFLPDPVFPHAQARFFSDTVVRMHPSATMLFSETLMPGRKHLEGGEVFKFDLFSSTVRVEDLENRELLTEKFVVDPQRDNLRLVGKMAEFDVFGNVFVLTPPEKADEIWARTPTVFSLDEQIAAAVSRLPNQAGLVYKILAKESPPVAAKVREFWAVVRDVVKGKPIKKEFLWR